MPNGGGVQIPDKMFPVTEAPASRQIRAAARSNPCPVHVVFLILGRRPCGRPMGLLAAGTDSGLASKAMAGCMVVLGTPDL